MHSEKCENCNGTGNYFYSPDYKTKLYSKCDSCNGTGFIDVGAEELHELDRELLDPYNEGWADVIGSRE